MATTHDGKPEALAAAKAMGLNLPQWSALLVSALAARALFAFGILGDMPLQSDALQYSNVAQELLTSFPGDKPYFWPPGLPYYLAATYWLLGSSLTVSRVAMILLGIATTLMVTRVAWRAFGRSDVARAAGWLAALYPPSLLMAGQTYTQELASLCLLVLAETILAFARKPRVRIGAPAGIALGIGIITRPSMLSVLIILGVVALGWAAYGYRKSGRIALTTTLGAMTLCVIGILPLVLSVMAHNASKDAGWSLSVNNEMNFFMGNNPYTHYYKTSHLAQRSLDRLDPEVAAYLGSIINSPDPRARMRKAAIDHIIAHPMVMLWRCLSRARAFWGFDYIMSRRIQNHRDGRLPALFSFLLLEAGGYCLVMLAVFAGFIVAIKAHESLGCLVLLGLALAYKAPYVLAFSSATYHFPVMGLLMPIAAMTITRSAGEWPPVVKGERLWFWAAAAIFTLVLIEYGYHAASMSGF